ncbi:unnamed protein product [marine sediment metagenome]|uniref:Uncharacterized protein n=1 Tax=marine sediment metagenome TaxID=412755 RepID=X1PAZ6_9ZZZZ
MPIYVQTPEFMCKKRIFGINVQSLCAEVVYKGEKNDFPPKFNEDRFLGYAKPMSDYPSVSFMPKRKDK